MVFNLWLAAQLHVLWPYCAFCKHSYGIRSARNGADRPSGCDELRTCESAHGLRLIGYQGGCLRRMALSKCLAVEDDLLSQVARTSGEYEAAQE